MLAHGGLGLILLFLHPADALLAMKPGTETAGDSSSQLPTQPAAKIQTSAGDPLGKKIMSFSVPGMCFATGVAGTYEADWQRIAHDVQSGISKAKTMKVIIAGVIRNGENSLRRGYDMFTRLASHFKDYRFVLYENDSDDNTAEIMRAISKDDPRFVFKSESMNTTFAKGFRAGRFTRMANARNKLLDLVGDVVQRSGSDWDLVVLYDFDLNLSGANIISPHALLGTLGRHKEWDMVCGNGLKTAVIEGEKRTHLADCFAFRDSEDDPDAKLDPRSRPPSCKKRWKTMYDQYDLVPVHSCFGGVAMYQTSKFLKCRYDPRVDDCEHVPFHKCIMEQNGGEGRMFMDPLLTTSYDGSDGTGLQCRRNATGGDGHV